ncbi:DUF4127 family protein [Saccharibacillus kuerlensis]|uniref:DUF4127 family protein n=1 Tax=Saccharibacillus kuerlensis TaxID=459527 RepID=A0ABQ2KZF9_9BACL|nr:DUF4127 family protein [Saccharibacillus kuerlensis]GGN97852.1 hypothetical protein GCM10010969_16190 [Saccharibacillus kuerlensis]
MKKVVYVPLDDRPANLDDVIVQGKAAGLEVLTPERSIIRNRMDDKAEVEGTEVIGTSGAVYGDSAAVGRFLKENASQADGFIISIDMLAYGGLIGSRRLREDGGGDYPDYDPNTTALLNVIADLKRDYPGKPIFLLDTIMRLATTTMAEGLSIEAYTESRALMMKPRPERTEFGDILESYDLQPDGTPYPETVHFDKERYYNARRRKFKTNRYVLETLVRDAGVDFAAFGVDDASIQGVQANEINWIERQIDEQLGGSGGQNSERAVILPDADGLGHVLLARMAAYLYADMQPTKPIVAVRYFGRDGSEIVNSYEYMDVHTNILRHIDIAGGAYTGDGRSPVSGEAESGTGFEAEREASNEAAENEAATNGVEEARSTAINAETEKSAVQNGTLELELVALTSEDAIGSAIAHIEANRSAHIPTLVVDFTRGGSAGTVVTPELLASPATGSLLGYSGWNTAGNKIGISLGMALSRFFFLKKETQERQLGLALDAHGSLLFKRFLKDYSYKTLEIGSIRTESRARTPYTNVTADQNMRIFNTPEDYEFLTDLLRRDMQTRTNELAAMPAFGIGSQSPACIIRRFGIPQGESEPNSRDWRFAQYANVRLPQNDPGFIWWRAFEITLNPEVELQRTSQGACR